jgi:hypothetical protein
MDASNRHDHERPVHHGPAFAAIAVTTCVLSFVLVVAGAQADRPRSGAEVPGPVWYLGAALTVAAGFLAAWALIFPGRWWVRPAKVIAALAALTLLAGIVF